MCLLIYDGGLCDSNLMVEVSPISYDTKICLSLLLCSSSQFWLLHGMLMDLCLSKREAMSVSMSNLVQFTLLRVKGDSDQMMF